MKCPTRDDFWNKLHTAAKMKHPTSDDILFNELYTAARKRKRKPTKTLFQLCLKMTVTDAFHDRHRIGKDLGGRRCGKDITPKDLIEALRITMSLSGDPDIRNKQLREIAVLTLCKWKNCRHPHYEQASAMVKKWIAMARKQQQGYLEEGMDDGGGVRFVCRVQVYEGDDEGGGRG